MITGTENDSPEEEESLIALLTGLWMRRPAATVIVFLASAPWSTYGEIVFATGLVKSSIEGAIRSMEAKGWVCHRRVHKGKNQVMVFTNALSIEDIVRLLKKEKEAMEQGCPGGEGILQAGGPRDQPSDPMGAAPQRTHPGGLVRGRFGSGNTKDPSATAARASLNAAGWTGRTRHFTDREEQLVALLTELGTSTQAATILMYLAAEGTITSRDIGRGTGICQSAVSIATREMAERGWITIRETFQGRGRPMNVYELAMTVREIFDSLEKDQKADAENRLAMIAKMKELC